jgi:DhnA family fructose-bisphosphate aldolase class Ia
MTHQSFAQFGRNRRLSRLFSSQKRAVFVPVDDSLLSGAINGLENLGTKVKLIADATPNAIMGFSGVLKHHGENIKSVPFILNLTASTTRAYHTRKTLIGSVELAHRLGADAVAVHVNIGSQFETEMLSILGSIARECDSAGMPLLGIMYPRTEGKDGDENFLYLKNKDPQKYAEYVAHAARVGVDVGVDFIKTQYTGTIETFQKVVEASYPVPVVVAGGPALPAEAMLKIAFEVVSAGGAGVSFGRNIFSRPDPARYIMALKSIVHDGSTVEKASQVLSEKI